MRLGLGAASILVLTLEFSAASCDSGRSHQAATPRPRPAGEISPPTAFPVEPILSTPAESEGLSLTGGLTGTVSSLTPGESCGTYGGGLVAQARFRLGEVVYELVIDINEYRGPGRYPAPPTRVSVHKVATDNLPELYSGTAGGVLVAAGGRSGTVDADLLGNSSRAHISGTWHC